MGNKWEKDMITRDGVATKTSTTGTSIFSTKEVKKEERYKMFIDVQRKKMEFDRQRFNMESEKIELEKQEKYAKWELERAATLQRTELKGEKMRLA